MGQFFVKYLSSVDLLKLLLHEILLKLLTHQNPHHRISHLRLLNNRQHIRPLLRVFVQTHVQDALYPFGIATFGEILLYFHLIEQLFLEVVLIFGEVVGGKV